MPQAMQSIESDTGDPSTRNPHSIAININLSNLIP